MRIAINAATENPDQPSGALGYYRNIIRELVKHNQDSEFHVVVSEKLLPFFDPPAPNLKFILVPHSNESTLRRVFGEHLSLPGKLSRVGIDVLNTGNVAPIRVPCKLVATIKTMHAFTVPQSLPFAKLVYRRIAGKWTASHADFVIANSESNKSDIQNYFGVDDDRIRTVYEAVDHDVFRPEIESDPNMQTPQGFMIEKPFVVFVSSLWRYKNAEVLIKAASIWSKSFPELSVVLAGYHPDYSYLRELRSLTSDLGLTNRILFTGGLVQGELLRLYRTAEAMVYPSTYETFGLPIIEAMASGCPVVASNRSSLPEVGGPAGLYFEPHDPDELADIIEKLVSDSELRNSQINLGIKRAAEFTWERTALETMRIFKEAHDV